MQATPMRDARRRARVDMLAFPDEGPLTALIGGITATNAEITRAADKIRLFQVPLERMI